MRLSWAATRENLVWNGGFEAGLDQGWSVRSEGIAAFGVATTFGPAGGAVRPQAGSCFALVPTAVVGGRAELAQRVQLPASATRLSLSWWALLRAEDGTKSGAEFRLEVRGLDDVPRAVVFATDRFETRSTLWKRQEASLDAFRGQDVVLAFVFESGLNPYPQRPALGLDELRLSWGSPAQGEFEVYVGKNATLGPADLVGRTAEPTWRVPELARGTTFYWQVVAVRHAERAVGPVWSFTTASSGSAVAEALWKPPGSPQVVGVPSPLAVTLVDSFGKPPVTARGSVQFSAAGAGLRAPTIVITEVDPGTTNAIEFMNVADHPVCLAGMRVDIYSGSFRAAGYTFPTGVMAQPGDVFVLHARGPAGQYPNIGLPNSASFMWLNGGVLTPVMVILSDSVPRVVDVFCSRGAFLGDVRPSPPDPMEWRSTGVGGPSLTDLTWQRFGRRDRDERSDWRVVPRTLGQRNDLLDVPFQAGDGPVALTPSALLINARPGVTNDLQFLSAAPEVDLFAEVAMQTPPNFRQVLRTSLDVLPALPLWLERGAPLREGAGTMATALWLRSPTPRTTNVTARVELAATDQASLDGDGVVVIPAGTTETRVPIAVRAIDDALIDGTQNVEVRAVSEGFFIRPLILPIEDNETATLTLALPTQVSEASTAEGRLRVQPAPDRAVAIPLESGAIDTLSVPATVVIPAGASEVAFPLTAPDDRRLNGSRTVAVRATMAGWAAAAGQVEVTDNESMELRVVLPARVAEGGAILPGAGLVLLPGTVSSNVVVTLRSAVPADLAVPNSVTIPEGEMFARFDLAPGENANLDGARPVQITASASGFIEGAGQAMVADNDPARIAFELVATPPSPQPVGEPFQVAARGFDVLGEPLGGISPGVALRAEGASGPVILAGNPAALFVDGAWSGRVTAQTADRAVRLIAEVEGARFESAPFNVVPSPVAAAADVRTLDLAWDAGRQRLIASVGSDDPARPNTLAVLDVTTGGVIKTFAAGPFVEAAGTSLVREGRLLIAGDRLYVSAGGGTRVQQFDLVTDTFTREYTVGSAEVGGFVGDMAEVPGRPGTVLVGLTDGGTSAGLQFLRAGGSTFSGERAATLLVPGAHEGLVHGYVENSPFPWYRIDVAADGALTAQYSGAGQGAWAAGDARRFDREIVMGSGQVVDTATFELPRRYEVQGAAGWPWHDGGAGKVEFGEDGQRVFFVARDGSPDSHLVQVFLRDRVTVQRVARVPTTGSHARRLLRANEETLAFNTSERVYFVRAGWLLPTGPFAALEVAQTPEPPSPMVGEEFTLNLEVTNRGPALATDVVVERSFEPLFELVSASVSGGTTTMSLGTWRWHQLALPAGQSALATLRLRARMAGVLTNDVLVRANEWNPALPAGYRRFTTPVRVDLRPDEPQPVAQFGQHLAWDQGRGLLYAASAEGTIVGLNPQTGLAEFGVAAGGKPARLALSDDGQFLYVAVNPGQIRRLDLGPRAFDLSWASPGNVLDLAGLPGQPHAVAMAALQSDGFVYHLAVYDDGAVRSRGAVTSPGPWLLAFGNDAAELFAWGASFASPRLHVFGVNAEGAFEQAYTDFDFGHGAGGLEYDNRRLYLGSGEVLDAEARSVLGRLPGTIDTSRVAVDAPNRRLFSLARRVDRWWVQVHELHTWARLGSFALPPSNAQPLALVRWGADGLAVLPENEPLQLVRVADLPLGSPANLALDLAPETEPAVLGQASVLRATLQNRGPNPVEAATFAVRLPASLSNVVLSSDAGSCTNETGVAVCRVPVLAAGAEVSLRIEGRPQAAGVLLFEGAATSRASETDWSDNQDRLELRVELPPTRDQAFPIECRVVDVAPDPTGTAFYASVAADDPVFANAVVIIDAATGGIQPLIGNLPGPSLLAVSAEGSRLYVATDGARTVHRVRTATGQSDLSFSLTANPDLPIVANELAVAPHDADRLVVGTTAGAVVAFDNGRPLGGQWYWGREVEFYANDELIATEPNSVPSASYRLASRPEGLVEVERLGSDVFDGTITAAGDRLFTAGGMVLRLPDVVPLGQFPVTGPVAADLQNGRVLFLVREPDSTLTLRAHALAHYGELGRQSVGRAALLGKRLYRGRGDGLAYVADGRLHLIRTSLLPQDSDADLALSFLPDSLAEGRNQLVVHNAGPNMARGVVARWQAPVGMTLGTVQAPGGAAMVEGNTVECRFDTIPAGGEAVVSAQVNNPGGAVFVLHAVVRSDAADPDLRNNRAALTGGRALTDPNSPLRRISGSPRSLAADPDGRRLWLTVEPYNGWPAGILGIDAVTGRPIDFAFTDGVPGRIAATPNGRYLYTVLGSRLALQRLTLPELRSDLTFPIGDAAMRTTHNVNDLAVSPGEGRTAAVSLWDGTLRVFDDDRLHPDLTPGTDFSTYIEFGDAPDRLWTVNALSSESGVRRFRLTPEDVVQEAFAGSLQYSFGADFRVRQGRLFLSTGDVIDGATLERIAILPGPLMGTLVAVDALPGRVMLGSSFGSSFAVHDAASLQPVGEFNLTSGWSSPRNLVRWGANGFAFLGESQLMLARSDLLAPPADQDTDGDGLPDAYELEMGFSPFAPSAADDADGDGASNGDEYVAGTDARNADDVLRVDVKGPGQATFPTVVGRRYWVERCRTLSGPWEVVSEEREGNGDRHVIDWGLLDDNAYFYRVRVSR